MINEGTMFSDTAPVGSIRLLLFSELFNLKTNVLALFIYLSI